MIYLALLRGINVGGNNQIKMTDLKVCFEKAGFSNVKTYIQTGNIVFESSTKDQSKLTTQIEQAIKKTFGFDITTLVLSHAQLRKIVTGLPVGFGDDPEWKYNVLFLIPPYEVDEIIKSIGELKPDIETLIAGEGVIYQSMSKKLFGKATTGKLAAKTTYNKMTIRNLNTTRKLLTLMDQTENGV
jgi:uncharacterized protein (DUF1697 family)